MGDARTPARAAAISVVVSAVLGAVLMLQLDRVLLDGFRGLGEPPRPPDARCPTAVREVGPLRLGAVGLALAASVQLVGRVPHPAPPDLRGSASRSAIGGGQLAPGAARRSLVVAVVGLGLRPLVDDLPPPRRPPARRRPGRRRLPRRRLLLGVPEAWPSCPQRRLAARPMCRSRRLRSQPSRGIHGAIVPAHLRTVRNRDAAEPDGETRPASSSATWRRTLRSHA